MIIFLHPTSTPLHSAEVQANADTLPLPITLMKVEVEHELVLLMEHIPVSPVDISKWIRRDLKLSRIFKHAKEVGQETRN